MRREEFYFAILAGEDPDALGLWNRQKITSQVMEKFIFSLSKGLAELTKSKNPTVQFIHESVREFLLEGSVLDDLWPGAGTSYKSY